MKKTYKIEVDCAACADKMEQAAQKTQGVAAATVSFMTQKMKVEFAEGADVDAVMRQVLKNCKKGGGRLRDIPVKAMRRTGRRGEGTPPYG